MTSRRPPADSLTLRIGSHNVRGLHTNVEPALLVWDRHMHFDVVAVQEVHLDYASLLAHQHRLHDAGYGVIWNSGATSAGVAIVYKQSLVTSGKLVVHEDQVNQQGPCPYQHRVLAVPMDWGGHTLLLVNLYVPNTNQHLFLQEVLPPIRAAYPGRQVVLLGDFNFVPSPPLDRARAAHVAAAPDQPTPGDYAGPPALTTAWPGLSDAFRVAHPHRHSYTFTGPSGQARLDRFYIPAPLTPFVHRCWVGTLTPSDHRPIGLSLSTTLRPTKEELGRGVKRLRLHFWAVRALQQEFLQWLDEEIAGAPQGDAQMVAWWPHFKQRLVDFARQLNRRASAPSSPDVWAAAKTARTRLSAAYDAADRNEPGAFEQIRTCQAAWVAAEAEARRVARATQAAPPPWLHVNERPSPFLTSLVRPAASKSYVPALRDQQGRLFAPGRAQAEIMATHYAAVSSCPNPPTEEATTAVLAAVDSGATLSPEAAEALGAKDVSVAEVVSALKHSKPGKAPGLDGIPVDLYRRCKTVMAPLLARLYSALGATGVLPAGFLNGVITCLPKGGDSTQPANYRPITLLNTDYRVLAKVLANRLLHRLDDVISPTQSAFLKDRSIGNNIHLLQVLPYALQAAGHSAFIAFLDIAKAYDTVHRDFLRQVMLHMGVGEDFVQWVTMLLTGTCACAVVNGFVSDLHLFTAGVRQGCPLAPLLYLFVGEALYRFLSSQGIGFVLPGLDTELVASQFADDTHVFVPSLENVPELVSTLTTFKDASGQSINLGKSKLLPIGPGDRRDWAAMPASCCGIPIVTSVKALGLTFQAGLQTPTPKQPWEALIAGVEETYQRIRRLPLSAFGRAFAAGSYGTSTLLFAAEYLDLPPPELVEQLHRATALVVDVKHRRNDNRRQFRGVARELQFGHPSAGGFGAFPWEQHIRARHAVWAVRLLLHEPSHPWVRLGRSLLSRWFGDCYHPLVHFLGTGDIRWAFHAPRPARPPPTTLAPNPRVDVPTPHPTS